MDLRYWFRRNARPVPKPPAVGGPETSAPRTKEQLAELQGAREELAQAAGEPGVSHLHAGTRNGKSWEDDPAAVGAMAALPGHQRPANAPEGPADQISKSAVLAILEAESLGHVNWFEDRYPRAHEAGIQKVDDGWLVYGSDERAAARYEKVYTDEGQALTDFLDMARFNHRRHWDEDYKRYEQQLFKKSRERRASSF